MLDIPKTIFKAYDIRGIVGRTLTPEIVEAIGHAIGSEAQARAQHTIAIGRDGRLSGPALLAALARGIRKSGINVIDIGCVATPITYFAAFELKTDCCVMLTGSHNPPDYNGIKIVLAGEDAARRRHTGATHPHRQQRPDSGNGSYTQHDIGPAYIARIIEDVKLARPMTVTVDCGNGAAGAHVAELYRQMGCSVHEMYCEVDGHFPNHHPDPSDPKNLQDMIAALQSNDSELGLAYDGDGDRLGVVTKQGDIIYPDRQLMLFAADLLSRHPGAEILFDIKCTRNLYHWIRSHGGKPTIWKTGHSLLKAKMKETGALLAAEMSGHMFFKERWYGFDDGLYTGARLLEILSRVDNISATLNALPDSLCTPELHIQTEEGEHHALIEQLKHTCEFPGSIDILTLDGIRVEYPDGFGLARPSNTTPVIMLRFEGDTQAALERIQQAFRSIFQQAAPHLKLPF